MPEANTEYQWWENALNGRTGPIHDGQPQAGFYRRRSRENGWEGIAIWKADGKMVATMGKEPADPNTAWTWAAKNPIAYPAYKKWDETGRFPDDMPAPQARGSVPGDNLGDGGTVFDQLRRESLDLGEQLAHFVDKTGKSLIDSQEAADRAAVLAKAAGQLSTKADGERDDEKRPHLEAGRRVDDKWRTVILASADTCKRAKLALAPFLRRKEHEEEARQAAERAQAQALAEQATALSRSADKTDQERAAVLEEQVAEHEVASRPKRVSVGRTGARVTMRTVLVAVVEDYDLALAHFCDHPEVKALIDKLAQQAVTAKQTVPGVKAVQQEKPV